MNRLIRSRPFRSGQAWNPIINNLAHAKGMSIQPATAEALVTAFQSMKDTNTPSEVRFSDRDRAVRLRAIVDKGRMRVDYIQEGEDPYEQWNELDIHGVRSVRYYPKVDGDENKGVLEVSSDIITANVDVVPFAKGVCGRYNLSHPRI